MRRDGSDKDTLFRVWGGDDRSENTLREGICKLERRDPKYGETLPEMFRRMKRQEEERDENTIHGMFRRMKRREEEEAAKQKELTQITSEAVRAQAPFLPRPVPVSVTVRIELVPPSTSIPVHVVSPAPEALPQPAIPPPPPAPAKIEQKPRRKWVPPQTARAPAIEALLWLGPDWWSGHLQDRVLFEMEKWRAIHGRPAEPFTRHTLRRALADIENKDWDELLQILTVR
jgi:hypothetical protein